MPPLQLIYPALVLLGLRLSPHAGASACAALLSLAGLLLWLRTFSQGRAVQDTPTARIASAAQGYVEVRGRLKPLGGSALFLPGSQLPCVWYRVLVEERSGDEWRSAGLLVSQESLLLDDGSGECLVFWEGATLLGTHAQQWEQNDRRYQERWLAIGDTVTVLGMLRSRSGGEGAPTLDQEVGERLAEWKRDRTTLLRRFDHNGDGEIDLAEWEEARAAARAEVSRQRLETPDPGETHVISRPEDGRPFLISALSPQRLRLQFALVSLLDVAAFFGGLWWLVRLLQHRPPTGPW